MNIPYRSRECKDCEHNTCIKSEFQEAENFWKRNGERTTYIFECGAFMNPSFGGGVERPENCKKDR